MNSRPLALGISLSLLFLYVLSYSGIYHAVDELSALSVTTSILSGQGVQVNAMAWDQSRTPPQNEPGIDGQLYSKKGIGLSLLALPLFALGQAWWAVGAVQMTLLLNPLLGALLAYLFFHLVLTLGYPRATAVIGTFALGLGTLTWPYTRTLFSEPLAMLGVGLTLYGAVAFRRRMEGNTGKLALALASGGLALTVLAKPANAVLIPLVLLYLTYVLVGESKQPVAWSMMAGQILSFGLPVGLAVSGVVLYNYLRFHTFFTFPLANFERFDTPLSVGLPGLLLSPGKGLFWYTPLAWLIWPSIPLWRQQKRLPDHLLAAGMVLCLLILYARWYDWPGGRAWGPRMIVLVVPALVVLTLPVLEAWGKSTAKFWQRSLLVGVLIVSGLVQIPGVLVNFERQEGLDMQSGTSFAQLIWDWQHSPLLTYWGKIALSPDPVWLQPFFWQQPGWQIAGWLLLGMCGAACLIIALRARKHRLLLPTTLLIASLALLFVIIAKADPRWQERSAAPADNAALLEYVQTNAWPTDLVLLDLLPQNDIQGRVWWWLNEAPGKPPAVGWQRQPPSNQAAYQRLQGWLQRQDRVWLALQATNEGSADSTTELWLDHWAYRGRQQWIGSQRVVEYLLPASATAATKLTGPFVFSDTLSLQSVSQQVSHSGAFQLVTLQWATPATPTLRFSLQALDQQGQLVAQLDRAPGQVRAANSSTDLVGLVVPGSPARLILKVYRADNGVVLPVRTPAGEVKEYLELSAAG